MATIFGQLTWTVPATLYGIIVTVEVEQNLLTIFVEQQMEVFGLSVIHIVQEGR